MIPYLLFVATIFTIAYMNFVRPARKHRKAALAVPAVPEPELREPRDQSRPYPRKASACGELLDTCPICGMADPGNLDGDLLGWPAHSECREWLGDWKPKEVVPFRSPGTTYISVSNSPGAQVSVGGTMWTGNEVGLRYLSPDAPDLQAQLANGLITLSEFRERLNREIVASWGVPPATLEEHTHKVGDPVPTERCPKCGAQFAGTPDYLRGAFMLHRQVGCRP